jgi:uncharacterized protein YegP (UPF0339 family)
VTEHSSERSDQLEFYRDGAGEVRWRYQAAGNHEVLADSSEGYERLAQAMESAYRVVGIADPARHALLASATRAIAANRADGTHVQVVVGDLA